MRPCKIEVMQAVDQPNLASAITQESKMWNSWSGFGARRYRTPMRSEPVAKG